MLNMGGKQIEKMMKQMGISQENIDAEQVIIKGKGRSIIIDNPQVVKIKMGGQDTFQVMGQISESAESFSEEDVKMVAEQTGASEAEAKKALEDSGGEVAAAILKLKG